MHIKIYVFEGADYEYYDKKVVGTNMKKLLLKKYKKVSNT